MKVRAQQDEDTAFELTSMIDVVFLLIAFFMTVTSFATAELVKVQMPIAAESKVPEDSRDRQFISIDKEGNYFLGARPSNIEEIKAALAARAKNPDFKGVYLRADEATHYRFVSEVMKGCAEVEIYNVIFGVEQQ
ncbi:MAG: biopolymer transporter ExbD [Opitutales bacterium]|nr:biopolymer transporter ExbD [Opitutales bacterium]